MFWKKKKLPAPGAEIATPEAVPSESNGTTVIAANYTLKGRIHGQGPVEVQGRMEGYLDVEGRVLISVNASMQGEIKAEVLEIGGKVQGQLDVSRQLQLGPTSRFEGKAAAARIVMAEGACLNGDVSMKA